jgi:WD40 repeat protein
MSSQQFRCKSHSSKLRGTRAYLPAIAAASLVAGGVVAAPPKVQFSRDVLLILNRECLGCHRGSAAPGGYSLENAKALLAGGRHGTAVVPGKSSEGTLIRYLTGELKPQMPPGKPLPLDTIAVFRRWIDGGAKIDSMEAPPEAAGIMRGAMPGKNGPGAAGSGRDTATVRLLPPAVSQSAPVTALGYSPAGNLIAAGGYRAVRLLDPQTGHVLQTLPGPSDQVLSLAWSADGKYLAAAGGVAGSFGEVCVWETGAPGGPWGKPRILKGHADAIAGIAWRANSLEFATVSPDKTARVWDFSTGQVKRTLKDHVDAVFGVAYSADGRWLATGSADRTVKLYQADKGARVASFPHSEEVTGVAFAPRGEVLVAIANRQIRVWPVKAGPVENPLRGHGEGETVNALAYSADGSMFAWGAANRYVRLWDAELKNQRRSMNDALDWIYAVTLSPDGKQVVAGAADGKVYAWETGQGKLLYSTLLASGAPARNGAAP